MNFFCPQVTLLMSAWINNHQSQMWIAFDETKEELVYEYKNVKIRH